MAGADRLRIEDTALVLLAAGRGSRFGDDGAKLEQEVLGRPLGLHVATALADLPFRSRVAVVGPARLDYAGLGFTMLRNDDPALGMARSVRIGVAAAAEAGAAGVLIALADMPRVTAAHVRRLFDAAGGADSVVASSDGRAPKPPALFGRGRFALLRTLDGDAGARDLLRAGRHVVAPPAELIDVDTSEELKALRALVASPDGSSLRA